MNDSTGLQVSLFGSERREELKKWAKQHNVSVRLLLYKLLDNRVAINKLLKEKKEK